MNVDWLAGNSDANSVREAHFPPRSPSDLSTTMNRQGAEQSELRDIGKDLPVGPCSWTRRGRCSANVCTAAAALHNFLSRQYHRYDPASRGGVGVKTVNDDSVYACVCMEEPRGKKKVQRSST